MIYQPAEDSYLLQRNIKNYVKNKSVLDMGAGSGIQTEEAIKAGAKSVISVDIDRETIEYLKKNLREYSKVKIIKSDLFMNIAKEKRFDLIAFNPPYLPKDEREDKKSRKITSGGNKGYETIIKFLKQAKNHLNKKGKILLIISSLTPQEKIKETLSSLKLSYKLIDEEKLFFEKLELWEINHSNQ